MRATYLNLSFVFLSTLLGPVFAQPQDRPRVSTTLGEIVGEWKDTKIHGKTGKVAVYMGIPYAEPPVADLRFRKPVPKSSFATPFDARRHISCNQFNPSNIGFYHGAINITEDCLILNVFVPSTASPTPRTVMVWIHGGGFNSGSSMDYPGEELTLMGDVIVVTMNYRLSFYGFLSTGDSHSQGNYGLFDQHLAIQWVQDNIHSFGGNASEITIFGESAGGSSVAFQTLYKGNKGLFQRAIAESGTSISPFAFTMEPEALARTFATTAGCLFGDWDTKLTCLRGKAFEELNATLYTMPQRLRLSDPEWKPVVDGDFVTNDPRSMYVNSLDANTRDMFNSVDLMVGANSYDGLLLTPSIGVDVNGTLDDVMSITRSQYEQYIEVFVQYISKGRAPMSLIDAAKFEFTDWSDPEDSSKRVHIMGRMLTDLVFTVPAVRTARAHCLNSTGRTTYVYQFSASPPNHVIGGVPALLDGVETANHADEIPFVFGLLDSIFQSNVTVEQEQVSKAVMTMWTNFAKTGNPNSPDDVSQYVGSVWPQFDVNKHAYMYISGDVGRQAVKNRLSPTSDAFISLAISLSEASSLEGQRCPTHPPNVVDPGLVG